MYHTTLSSSYFMVHITFSARYMQIMPFYALFFKCRTKFHIHTKEQEGRCFEMLLLILFNFYNSIYYYRFTVEINFVVTVILTKITTLALVAAALLSAFANLQKSDY